VPARSPATPPPRTRPLASEPARNTGDSAFDVDGKEAPRPTGGQDDRGAVEWPASEFVWGLYLDVGLDGLPSDVYGAATGIPGKWASPALGTGWPLTDIYGNPTLVTADLLSEATGNDLGNSIPDGDRLFRDHMSTA
jgi:hypothetical protein